MSIKNSHVNLQALSLSAHFSVDIQTKPLLKLSVTTVPAAICQW